MSDGRGVELYLVTDTALCGGPDGVVETAEAAARGGVDMIQIRDHDASTRELCSLTTRVIDAVATARRVRVVVDDRLDVALAIGADGVHLGQSDLDPVVARRLADRVVGEGFHLGWSVSNLEQVAAATRLRCVRLRRRHHGRGTGRRAGRRRRVGDLRAARSARRDPGAAP